MTRGWIFGVRAPSDHSLQYYAVGIEQQEEAAKKLAEYLGRESPGKFEEAGPIETPSFEKYDLSAGKIRKITNYIR